MFAVGQCGFRRAGHRWRSRLWRRRSLFRRGQRIQLRQPLIWFRLPRWLWLWRWLWLSRRLRLSRRLGWLGRLGLGPRLLAWILWLRVSQLLRILLALLLFRPLRQSLPVRVFEPVSGLWILSERVCLSRARSRRGRSRGRCGRQVASLRPLIVSVRFM